MANKTTPVLEYFLIKIYISSCPSAHHARALSMLTHICQQQFNQLSEYLINVMPYASFRT